MPIGGTKWLYNFSVFLNFVFISIEIHDKAISENLRHSLKHVEIALNFTHPEVKVTVCIFTTIKCCDFGNDVKVHGW